MQIVFTSSSHGHYKGLPSMNIIFTRMSFFSCFFVHFHHTLFHGLAGACVNPGSFSFFVHALVCPITHSFLNGFQPNLVQHFPYVYSVSGLISSKGMVFRAWAHKWTRLNSHWLVLRIGGADFLHCWVADFVWLERAEMLITKR